MSLDKKRIAFNRAVLTALQDKDMAMADKLNSMGVTLGWWNTLHYWHTKGMRPTDAADKLIAEYHEHQWGPLERSHLGGNVHRKCQVDGCKVINALDEDEDTDE